mgnify:CR=1 FL=1
MGKLSGLNESLAAIMTRPQVPEFNDPRFMPPEPEDTAMLEALNALVEAVRSMPQAKLDVAQLVKAVKGIKLPESKPIDLTPIVEAISKIELEVEFPEHKPMVPCAYTFTVQRNEMGVMTGVVAVPGIVEAPEKTDKASYE